MPSSVLAWVILAVTVGVLAPTVVLLARRLRDARRERDALIERYRRVEDVEAERTRVLQELERQRAATEHAVTEARARADAELAIMARDAEVNRRAAEQAVGRLHAEIASLEGQQRQLAQQVAALDEQAQLHEFGFYQPHYAFASVMEFEVAAERIRERQKLMLSSKSAAVCDIEWTVNGSAREGRKQINQTLKLMIRAFNGECDAAIAKVRYNNVRVMEQRIMKAWETINGLAQVQQCRIASDYMSLKIEELRLTHEYEEKMQAEKEEQRRIREQMREEEIARREIEKAREAAEREEERYDQALHKARLEVGLAVGAKQAKLQAQITELELRLAEAHERKERAISRAQLTRSGHVYIISNLGSFGEHVYKIGMTRRLDPYDRIKELGDASVPFDFDVHAVIYTDDAPALECALHRQFARYRVNRVNERKEFFRVSIEAIAAAVKEQRADVTITLAAEAEGYWKTRAIMAEEGTLQLHEPPGVPLGLPTTPPLPTPVDAMLMQQAMTPGAAAVPLA